MSEPELGLKLTAYHEAGHVVAKHVLGFRVKLVTIVPSGDSQGVTNANIAANCRDLALGTTDAKITARWHEQIVTILAGGAAQRRFRPNGVRKGDVHADMEAVNEILWRLHAENECPHVLAYLQAKTQNLISVPKHWRMIEDLTASLVDRRTLRGNEIRQVLSLSAQRFNKNAEPCARVHRQ